MLLISFDIPMAQAPVAVDFSGKWALRTSENLDEYLKSMGVGFAKRKLAAAASMKQEVIQTGHEKIQIKNEDPRGKQDITLTTDGKENKFKNMQGEDMIGKCTWNDDKTKLTQEFSGKKSMTVVRYIQNGEMILEVTNDKGVTMKRFFKKA